MSTPTLYLYVHSVWGASAILAMTELGYSDTTITKKQVDLVSGDNFKPEFVRINPEATIPTLVADGKTYGNTTEVIGYLVKNAPKPLASKGSSTDILAAIHAESVDPNVLLLSARSLEELKAKSVSLPGMFVRGRQEALERITPTAPEDLAEFYKGKLAFNGFLSSIYAPDPSKATIAAWFHTSEATWAAIGEFILTRLPMYVSGGKFISGMSAPGEEDFQVAAWLARVVLLSGGNKSAGGISSLEDMFGKPVHEDVKVYWKNWSERESWAVAYANGLGPS